MKVRFKRQKVPKDANAVTVFSRRLHAILFRFAAILVLGSAVLAAEFIFIERAVSNLRQSRAAVLWATKTSDVLLSLSKDRMLAEELREKLEMVLPSAIEVPTKIIPDLKALGEELGVRADIQIGTEVPASAESPGSIALSFRADGSMGALLKYLREIERRPFVIRLESFSVSPLDQPGNVRQLTAGGKIYIR